MPVIRPLAELVGKIRREERYHRMHAETWLERLAPADGEPRRRLLEALERLGPDAGTVLTPLPTETALLMADIVTATAAEQEARWRATIGPTFERLRLPPLPPTADPETARTRHGDDFRALHAELSSVRRIDPTATW